jgi:hypothetical protein
LSDTDRDQTFLLVLDAAGGSRGALSGPFQRSVAAGIRPPAARKLRIGPNMPISPTHQRRGQFRRVACAWRLHGGVWKAAAFLYEGKVLQFRLPPLGRASKARWFPDPSALFRDARNDPRFQPDPWFEGP